ncbi:1,2-phenylacetyl-CoA epoxidase subunit PaaD [Streptomyces sp. NEAU-H3]|uniref:1,2-phenylacetyl-CoA epoxidase subunit PaaD n=1 Tax=unclassified Streptomyces TaxID=2593676 RepID=UPI0014389903|nr:phenylacetate-CoA oxygenase subunit PaaJ [Streptomyces sp. NEAU-H3]
MVSAAAPVSDPRLRAAWEAAGRVPDPELPMLSLHDLGVLRDLAYEEDGTLVVSLTPTYSGCPAMAEMRAATVRALNGAGFGAVRVRTVLDPPWTTDWMTEEGRAALAAHHIVPPGPAPGPRRGGPVPLSLSPTRHADDAAAVRCPQCGADDAEELSRFSATSCRSLHRCRACGEPFERFKEI